MKLMIPVDDALGAVCASFARASYFILHDTETNLSTLLENPAARAEGGAGTKAAQFILDSEADALITIRCGENAAKVLKLGEVAIHKALSGTAAENIAAYRAGDLPELTHFHTGFHGIR